MTDVAAISAGVEFSLFVKTDETVWGTGMNRFGQLGTGTKLEPTTPVQIMENVKGISAGENFSLFLTNEGAVFGVGQNGSRQLGVEGKKFFTPVEITFCGRTRSEIEAEKQAWKKTMRNDRSSFIVPILTDPPRTHE
jgi:alpha-tubulin suppressor-like RCC1 family protein